MIEAKKSNLSLFVERTPLVGDAAVSMSFKAKLNSCCLNKLKGACDCECFPEGSEEACACFALYLIVNDALCGNPLATAKSKVGAVDCGANGGYFSITWKVKGTGSAIRKSLGIALKCLSPSKAYSVYAQCVKAAKGPVSRACFDYVADELTKSIKDMVYCGVVGNVKTDAATAEAMLSVLAKKLSPTPVKGAKHKPAEHSPCDHSKYTELKTSGWQSFVTRDYIASKAKGLSVVICDKTIMIKIAPNQYDTLSNKLKKYVKDYVSLKYDKVGDNLLPIMGYLMISSASVGTPDIKSLLKSNTKSSDIAKVISDSL